MKDEEFDELMRQKLESGSGLPASPADVSRVMKYLSNKKGFPVKSGISRWWYFIVPVAAVVTYFAVVRNSSENQIVQNHKQEISVPADSILKDQKAAQKNQIPADLTASPGLTNKPSVETEHMSKPGKNSAIKYKTVIEPDQFAEKSESTDLPNSFIPVKENTALNVVTPNDLEDTVRSIIVSEAKAEDKHNIGQIENSVDLAGNSQQPRTSDEKIEKVINQPFIQIPDTGTENTTPTKHRTQQNPRIRSLNNNGIFKKTNEGEFKVGPSFAVFQHSYGFGLDAYRSVLKNSGIHAGFHYSVFQPERFTTREDFDAHHHHGQTPPFDDHLHDNEKPVDIIVTNKVLQFNAGITHYFRLKKQYSVLLSLGTNMDVKLWQNLNYKIENDSIRNNRFSFQSSEKATTFNNIYLTTGLEKSWKSWSFQVQPFLGYQFSSPGYRRFKWEPGIGAGVFYIFGK